MRLTAIIIALSFSLTACSVNTTKISNTNSPAQVTVDQKIVACKFIETKGLSDIGSFINTSTYFKKANKYGFVDYNGKIVIQPKYEYASNFVEGLAAVKIINGKWGFIDKKGKIIIKPQYEWASDFSDGMCAVQISGKWGFINKSGDLVIKAKYNWAGIFKSNSHVACVTNSKNKYGVIDKNGKVVIDFLSEGLLNFNNNVSIFQKQGLCGLIDIKGKILVAPKYNFLIYANYNLYNGSKNGNNKFGCIDSKGKVVIDFIYSDLISFDEKGLAVVKLNDKFGYIDNKGKIAIKIKYDYAEDFTGADLAAVGVGKLKGYINRSGKIIIQPKFDWAWNFTNGAARVELGGKWGLIDEKGEYLLEPKFDAIGRFSKKYLATKATLNGKEGIIKFDFGSKTVENGIPKTENTGFRYSRDDKKIAEDRFKAIIEALDKKDNKGLKEMFSRQALIKAKYFDWGGKTRCAGIYRQTS